MNLKRRVTFAIVAVVALFVTAQGILGYLSLEEQEDDLADELVMTEARGLAGHAERGELRGPQAVDLLELGPNLSAWFVDRAGQVIPRPLPPHLANLGDGPHRPGRPDSHLHVVVSSSTAGRLYVQYDAEQSEAKVRQFGYYMIGLVVLCIAVGALVSWRVAQLVVAPIERLTARLADWAPEGAPADAAATDEESRLIGAFRRVQERFEQAMAREREFVANLGHEIRTPLAALRTDLEMLETSASPGSPREARLQRALASIDAITGSLESARTLSHLQRAAPQSVDLARCVDDAWASLDATPRIGELTFANEVSAGTQVVADRHALLTILRNLLRNAVEHAVPARCTVRCTEAGLEVVDNGPGISPQDLPFVFDRYYRGRLVDSPGANAEGDRGLGLAIARQVADLNGWTLTVHSEPAQGTRFVLVLKPTD